MKTIFYVTGNSYKFQIAKNILKDSGFKIVQKRMETPEIQSDSVEKVAAYSAQWASSVLKKPVAVSDGGCYIEALNGFPGPFAKYTNRWLAAKDLFLIMRNKKNKSMMWRSCLAYCEPGKKPVTFTNEFKGKFTRKIGKNEYRKHYGWLDTLFIPDGFSKPLSELSDKEYLDFWGDRKKSNWPKLLRYLEK